MTTELLLDPVAACLQRSQAGWSFAHPDQESVP
jgi:hypothetical protein